MIPKNASMSFRTIGIFEHQKGKTWNRNPDGLYTWHSYKNIPPDAVTILILRDPFKRLVSSYQYNCRKPHMYWKGITYTFNQYLKRIESGIFIATDIPQIYYIRSREIDLTKVTEIMLVEDLPKQFIEFKNKYNLEDVCLNFENKSLTEQKKQINIELSQEDNTRIFNKIYKEDITLYEYIKNENK
jgi:ribosomal protein L14E/L6E/L27E